MLGWCPQAEEPAARTWRRYSEPSSSLAELRPQLQPRPSSLVAASPKVTVLPPRPWTPVRGGRCARLPQPLTAQPGRAPCTFTCKLKAPPSHCAQPALGRPAGAEHLLIALLDQGTPEVTQTLSRTGLDAATVRQAALAVIGAAANQPPIPLPARAPATHHGPAAPAVRRPGRPGLGGAALEARPPAAFPAAPGHRLASADPSGAHAAATWRLTTSCGCLTMDQRYSLICHHGDQVERRVGQGRPDLARRRIPGRAAARMAIARGRRR